MIFRPGQRETAVWIHLPGQAEPVVCGRVALRQLGPNAASDYVYGRSYLARSDAIPLLPHDLPLERGVHAARRGLHGVLRDAAPDAWGRRVLLYRLRMSESRADSELTEIDYLQAARQRVGALHFQPGVDRLEINEPMDTPDLETLARAARAVETQAPLDPELAAALLHGTSIGGARPKVLVCHNAKPCIAKFSSTTDQHPMVRLEALALDLARRCGLEVPGHERLDVAGRDALLVERFDVDTTGEHHTRHHFFSALTALKLDEMEARYASYVDLADYLRRFGASPVEQCHELFSRMVFNILIGNTDDHARNHALFWGGDTVRLTPAYDLCVMPRVGGESTQAMEVGSEGKRSSLSNALSKCGRFGLDRLQAETICRDMIDTITDTWADAASHAELPTALSRHLMRRSVLAESVLVDF